MALTQLRLDLDTPLRVVRAGVGNAPLLKYAGGKPVGVFLGGHRLSFTLAKAITPASTSTDNVGIWTYTPVWDVTVQGLYQEPLVLQYAVKTFVDTVYKRQRPQQTELVLIISSTGHRYDYTDLYTMVSVEFSAV